MKDKSGAGISLLISKSTEDVPSLTLSSEGRIDVNSIYAPTTNVLKKDLRKIKSSYPAGYETRNHCVRHKGRLTQVSRGL